MPYGSFEILSFPIHNLIRSCLGSKILSLSLASPDLLTMIIARKRRKKISSNLNEASVFVYVEFMTINEFEDKFIHNFFSKTFELIYLFN